jgi:tyrosine aminotransferase
VITDRERYSQTDKPFINLSLGDPTKNPELQPSPATTEAVVRAVRSGKYNGYGPPDGLPQTKAALAEFYTSEDDGLVYSASDVIMANGASEALDMVVTVLCKPGSNILFPKPGFAYGACCNARRVEDRYYNLIPEREWECDFEHMKSLVDKDTAAIVITK